MTLTIAGAHEKSSSSKQTLKVESKLFDKFYSIFQQIKQSYDQLRIGDSFAIRNQYEAEVTAAIRSAVTDIYTIGAQYAAKFFHIDDVFLTTADINKIKDLTTGYVEMWWRAVFRFLSRSDVLVPTMLSKTATSKTYTYAPRSPLNSDYIITSIATEIATQTLSIAPFFKAGQMWDTIQQQQQQNQNTIKPRVAVTGLTAPDYGYQGGTALVMWSTAKDDRICFPAYTLVSTSRGQVYIKDIKPGDMILTRKGYRRCLSASSRMYQGQMNVISTSKGSLVCTMDHPIWVSGFGWKEARNIIDTDVLESFNDEPVKVFANLDFSLAKSNNIPSKTGKVSSLTSIPFGITMPINTINLDNNLKVWKSKITTIPTHLQFLDKLQIKSFKSFTYSLLKSVFTLKPPITTEGTVNSLIDIPWNDSEFYTATSTVGKDRWSSTFLRAMLSTQTVGVTIVKGLSTSLTSHVLSGDESTRFTANGVSMLDTSRGSEEFTTDRTEFGDHLDFPISIITLPSAPSCIEFLQHRRYLSLFSTSSTINEYESLTFIMSSLRHYASLLMISTQLFRHWLLKRSIEVFDIEVEGEHEFYANDILVHNCPYCKGQEGMTWEIAGLPDLISLPVPSELSHRQCRCRLVFLNKAGQIFLD